MVLQDDGDPNNGGYSDRMRFSPKNSKPNKIPQRGLGIAALEKLRREDQQTRIASSFSTGDTEPSPFLPVLGQNSKPYFLGRCALLWPHSDSGDGSSPLIWNSIQSESSPNSNSRLPLLHRKLQHEKHRCSMVIKNFLSPSISSGASLRMEPPSNQSYVSINHSLSIQEEQKLTSLKRSWPFQPCSDLQCGNDHKKVTLSRDDASSSSSSCPKLNARAEGGASKLDGHLLSLSLLPGLEQSTMHDIPFQKHYVLNYKQNQVKKNSEEKISGTVGPPVIHNFMGLPHDLVGNSPSNSDAEFRDGFY